MKKINYIIGGIIGLSIFIMWTENNDKNLAIASQKYEHCLETKYHVSPQAYYEIHGEYPICKD